MNKRKSFVLALIVVLLASMPIDAQQYIISNTTLNGAITATATTAVLTSASASSGSSFGAPAVGNCMFVEGELMHITAISSTTVTLQRGAVSAGSTVAGHATSAVVWTAPCNAFKQVDPPAALTAKGNQLCSTMPGPWINVNNGNIWWCNTAANTWAGTNYRVFTYGSTPTGQ
jgi:hypothetical protein